MARLNPAQHRLLQRHVERAVEALEEADRLLKGAVAAPLGTAIGAVRAVLDGVDSEESKTVRFALGDLPVDLVPYLDNPFAQALCFNRFCKHQGLSHTRATKQWEGGNAAVAARNVLFLPPVFADLWDEGVLDKDTVIMSCLKYMSEDDVADMAHANEFFINEEEYDEEDEE